MVRPFVAALTAVWGPQGAEGALLLAASASVLLVVPDGIPQRALEPVLDLRRAWRQHRRRGGRGRGTSRASLLFLQAGDDGLLGDGMVPGVGAANHELGLWPAGGGLLSQWRRGGWSAARDGIGGLIRGKGGFELVNIEPPVHVEVIPLPHVVPGTWGTEPFPKILVLGALEERPHLVHRQPPIP